MIVHHARKQRLHPGVSHTVPEQEHTHTRGHQVHLDITDHLDPETVIRYDSEVSTDGGETWTYGGGFTKQGGDPVDEHGHPITYCVVTFGHEPHHRHRDARGAWVGSDPAPHRLVRGTVTVSGQSVMTRVHVVGTKHAHTDPDLVPNE